LNNGTGNDNERYASNVELPALGSWSEFDSPQPIATQFRSLLCEVTDNNTLE